MQVEKREIHLGARHVLASSQHAPRMPQSAGIAAVLEMPVRVEGLVPACLVARIRGTISLSGRMNLGRLFAANIGHQTVIELSLIEADRLAGSREEVCH